MKSSLRFIFIWLMIIFGIFYIVSQTQQEPKKAKTIAFSEFIRLVDEGKVESVTIDKGKDLFSGKFKTTHSGGETFESVGDASSPYYQEYLISKGIKPDFKKEAEPSFFMNALLSWLPILAILFIFFLFMRQLQAGSNKALSFGQSKARQVGENQTKVKFTDVAGCDEAKDDLVEVVDFLKSPKKFTKLGGKIPAGVLLVGPPGTGKTLLAKAVAGEASVPFFTISGSDFVEMFVGVGASRVRSLFENAKRSAPCVIFIDEIDAVGRHRGAGLGGGHDEREQTLNQLLVEMDGFEGNEGIIVLAATNRVDVLDPALLRPGRFDRRVQVPKPDLTGRIRILEVHTQKVPLDADVDLSVIARGTPGFSGADLANLVNEAALNAARRNMDSVHGEDFEEAKDKVAMGAARKSMVISEDERRHTAYHESGHAILAYLVKGNDPVHKVTIIPRGPALGVTMTLPTEDRFTLTRQKAEAVITYMMGGRAAEKLIFNHFTTGASNDIERATDLARKMVTEWGFSDRLGPLHYGETRQNVFIGRELGQQTSNSEETNKLIDKEIRQIIEKNYDRALTLLEKNKDKLLAMSEALLKYETIDAKDVELIMTGKEVVKEIPEARKTPPKNPDVKGEKEVAEEDKAGVIDLSKPVKV